MCTIDSAACLIRHCDSRGSDNRSRRIRHLAPDRTCTRGRLAKDHGRKEKHEESDLNTQAFPPAAGNKHYHLPPFQLLSTFVSIQINTFARFMAKSRACPTGARFLKLQAAASKIRLYRVIAGPMTHPEGGRIRHAGDLHLDAPELGKRCPL